MGWCRTPGIWGGRRGWGVEIEAGLVPLSDAARAAGAGWMETVLTGGDDYELLMAVAPGERAALPGDADWAVLWRGAGFRVLGVNGGVMDVAAGGVEPFLGGWASLCTLTPALSRRRERGK